MNNEIYHAKGEARDDHKYLSREWKNGRWQYTYKEDQSKGTFSGQKSFNVPNPRTKSTSKVNSGSDIKGKYTGPKYSNEYLAERAANSKKNKQFYTDEQRAKLTTSLGKAFEEHKTPGEKVIDKFKSSAESAKKYFKDKFDTAAKAVKTFIENARAFVDSTMDKIGNSKLSKVSKEVIDNGKNYIENLFDKKGASTPVLSTEGIETILKENVVKGNVIKENVIKENVIKEDVIKENVRHKEMMDTMTVARVNATSDYAKAAQEYEKAAGDARKLDENWEILKKISDEKTIKKATKEYAKALDKSFDLQRKRDIVRTAKQELDDKLDHIENRLNEIKDLPPTELTRDMERAYNKQIQEAIKEYNKAIK